MNGTAALFYLAIVVVALACHGVGRLASVSAAFVALLVGLVLGRTGFQVVEPMAYTKALPAVLLHLSIVLGAVGYRLGTGLLRLPLGVIVRRSLLPLAVALVAMTVAVLLVPRVLPDAEAHRPFLRFDFPLGCALGVLPLLAVRDLRGRPPSAGGSSFFVAIALFGAVASFSPHLIWAPVIDAATVWRSPIIVLGESGALGVALAVLHLFASRRLGFPRLAALVASAVGLVAIVDHAMLWMPFAALGYGIVLGRAGEPRVPFGTGWMFAETPFLLLATLTFAPDLFVDDLAGPALGYAAGTAALVLAARAWHPRGPLMVTGPGLLFLGLAVVLRLDGRMSPITRYVIDFALPAWIVSRVAIALVERRRPPASPRSPGTVPRAEAPPPRPRA